MECPLCWHDFSTLLPPSPPLLPPPPPPTGFDYRKHYLQYYHSCRHTPAPWGLLWYRRRDLLLLLPAEERLLVRGRGPGRLATSLPLGPEEFTAHTSDSWARLSRARAGPLTPKPQGCLFCQGQTHIFHLLKKVDSCAPWWSRFPPLASEREGSLPLGEWMLSLQTQGECSAPDPGEAMRVTFQAVGPHLYEGLVRWGLKVPHRA